MRGPMVSVGITGEDFARERHPGSLAAAGQKIFAQFDEVFGASGRLAAPVARKQRAAALGNRLQ